MNRTHVAYGILVLMLLSFVARVFVPLHDLYALPFLLAGVGAVVLGRGWKGWALGAAFATMAIYLSQNRRPRLFGVVARTLRRRKSGRLAALSVVGGRGVRGVRRRPLL